MPSERAKENKQLVASCAGCGKELSTELLIGVVFGIGRQARSVPVCEPCRAKGLPEAPAAPAPLSVER